MVDSADATAPSKGTVPTLLAADLQDHLMTASNRRRRAAHANPVTQGEVDAGSVELF